MEAVTAASGARRDEIQQGLAEVRAAVQRCQKSDARLVAVSKYKPAADILAAYEAGQRHFGENYVQELCDKAAQLPTDIQWHFIGRLQSNKCKALAAIPNLWAVETVESADKAQRLGSAWHAAGHARPLGVFLQVNTSGEENKGGVPAAEAAAVAREIVDSCPGLCLRGLMTIGSVDGSEQRPNPDFVALARLRDEIGRATGAELELSMGMSGDFEHALELGATNVRVGSSVFGAR
ncbi:hypothetical protein IWQ56_001168 [Coemansia nantahalensis]|uniref:Uncharacterized protein n=1 Tax=Coemansia nantahalensis TaxID=2789366 RepID=A0ACC1JQD6_9FUNG|nr:hypothetical protein IWQ57_004803 [Coemansia nantahalensis]KAJ2772962.1 hypothetical protein IWQ56_001168 [Coemansia nantahalensis]